jgi:exopolysaccharide production protein ExoZ
VKLNSIQVLRGLAASAVMLYHVDKSLFPYGWAGVDLFFVISGFVMAKIELNQTPRRFFLKRLIRILPLYWLATTAMFIFVNYFHMFGGRSYTLIDLFKSLCFVPYATGSGDVWPIVVPGWSLNYEMFFYAIFALALFAPGALWMTMTALASAVVAGVVMDPQGPLLSTWTSLMLIEFAAGCLVARCTWIDPRVGSILIPSSVVYLITMLWVSGLDPTSPWGRVVVFGGAALFLVLGSLLLEECSKKLFAIQPLVTLGDISYSLYLLHSFAFALVLKWAGQTVCAKLTGCLVAVSIAYFSWVAVERRFGGLLKWIAAHSKIRTTTAGLNIRA